MATVIKLTTINQMSNAAPIDGYTTPTQTTADAEEVFGAAIEAADGKGFFIINNENGTAPVAVSLVAGNYVGAANTAAVTVDAGASAVLFANSALCKAKDGMLKIKLVPDAGANLAGCGVKLAAIQLLAAVNH